MNPQAIVAVSILGFAYFLIIVEKIRIHRTVASMIGAGLMIIAGTWMGFLTEEQAIEAIDWKTIFLLLGMMIIVGTLSETGLFQYIAIKMAKLANGNLWKIMLYFCVITAVMSAFLDNVTTILLMVPVTVGIGTTLEITPIPFLIAEVLASNIGGTATLIGDPPNIMIASGANLKFIDFIIHLAPIAVAIFFVTIFSFKFLFREGLQQKPSNIEEVMKKDEREEIQYPDLLKKALIVLGITLTLFMLQGQIGLHSWMVSLVGATLLLTLTLVHPERALHHVEWPTLVFFAAIFIMVGGIVNTGVIDLLAKNALSLTKGHLFLTLMVILWISGIVSAFLDNIPYTAIMIPLVMAISKSPAFAAQISHFDINPMWWALSLGACLGGNGSLIGASANVVMAGISEDRGYPLTFAGFLKKGMPVTLLSLSVSSLLLYVATLLFQS